MRDESGRFVKGKHYSVNTEFKKGDIPWNTGKKRPPFSDEWRMNMSEAKKGKLPKNLDLLHSPECRKKQADSIRGRTLTLEWRKRISESNKGKHPSMETRQKMSLAKQGCIPWNKDKDCPQFRGSNNGNWKGGSMGITLARVSTVAWKKRRKEIYERDGWTCLYCGKHVRKDIQCHHIIPYRFNQDDSNNNLITLCLACHILFERTFDHEFLFQGKLFSA